MSGGTSVRARRRRRGWRRCRNAVSPRGATVVTATLSMRAIGGACRAMAATAASTDAGVALEFAVHRTRVVEDEPADTVTRGNPRDGGPESDTLDHAGDVEAHPHPSPMPRESSSWTS